MSKQSFLAGAALLALAANAFADTDLAITGLDARDGAHFDFISPTQGHQISVWVDLENRSAENALDVPLVCRRGTDAINPPQSEATIRTGALAARARRTLIVRLTASAQAGTNYFSCTVDPANQLRESDETNNTMAETMRIEVDRPGDFEVDFRDFGVWTVGSSHHRTLPLQVRNVSTRGPALPAPSSNFQMRWQADCFIMQAPWASVREVGNMTHYPSGTVPARDDADDASFWLDPVDLSGYPRPPTLPPTLTLNCKITVGLFTQGPVVHRGDDIPRTDWMPVQTFWTKQAQFSIANPESSQYVPPQDVSLTTVTGSASATAAQPLISTRNAFARFTVRLVRSAPSLEVRCMAMRGSALIVNRTTTFGTTGTSISGAIDLGLLAAGSYRLECKADPNNRIPDSNPDNNSRSPFVTVHPPGVDLALRGIDARDLGRSMFITPSVGREIGVWVDVENPTGENAPDVAIVCRRSSDAGDPPQTDANMRATAANPPLAEVTLRTGVIPSTTRKTFTVRMPAPPQAGINQMWCMVDAGSVLRELDENNNIMAEPVTIAANRPNDFSIELREFQPWVGGHNDHRSVTFGVRNPSARGPASPVPPGSNVQFLWQAECFVIQMPWVRVREVGNMTHYPSGALPGPGATVNGTMWLDPVNLTGYPNPATLPRMLNLNCIVTTGLFAQGPVIHRGDDVPRIDWMPQQVWWRGNVMAALPNPDSNARP